MGNGRTLPPPLQPCTHAHARQRGEAPGDSTPSCSCGLQQTRERQACFLMPRPPNLGLSRQFLHCPQSPRTHPAQLPHRAVRAFLLACSSLSAMALPRFGLDCSRMQQSTAPQNSSHSCLSLFAGFGGGLASAGVGSSGVLTVRLVIVADVGNLHLRSRQDCLRMPCPPNLGLSRQLRHFPQSSRPHASQWPQATVRLRFFCEHCRWATRLDGAGLYGPELGAAGEGRPRLSPRAVISTAKGVLSAVIATGTATFGAPSGCRTKCCLRTAVRFVRTMSKPNSAFFGEIMTAERADSIKTAEKRETP